MSIDQDELIAKMRRALLDAYQVVGNQRDAIKSLSAIPHKVGVVIRVQQNAKVEHFRRGDKIITTEHADTPGQIGTVLREIDFDGEIRVEIGEDTFYVKVYNRETRQLIKNAKVQLLNSGRSASSVEVAVDGQLLVVSYPEGSSMHIRPGTFVTLSAETMQIVDVLDDTDLHGPVAIFLRHHEKGHKAEVLLNGERVIVHSGWFYGSDDAKEGDRLQLDPSSLVIIENLGQDDIQYTASDAQLVDWDQIGGLAQAKDTLRFMVEAPSLHQQLMRDYGIKPATGAVLIGPHGTGKTLLAKAAAKTFRDMHGGDQNPYLYIKGPELLSRFVGDAEAAVRFLFSRSRRFYEIYGYPMLIFIDEAEALLQTRGSGISSDVNNTVVAQFLAEMDGFENAHAFVLLATNRIDLIDPAILRDNRVGTVISVPRPDVSAAEEIFAIHLNRKPLNNGFDSRELAQYGARLLYDPAQVLYRLVRSGDGSILPLTLGDIASGAMIFGVVERAVKNSMTRDLLNGGHASGIGKEDIARAVSSVLTEQRLLDHKQDLAAIMLNEGGEFKKVVKVN